MATWKMFTKNERKKDRKKWKIKVSFRKKKTTLISHVHNNASEATSAPPHFINMNIIFLHSDLDHIRQEDRNIFEGLII